MAHTSNLEKELELEQLQNEARALEEREGITAAIERAIEGRFIPLGIGADEDVSPAEYFADERDHYTKHTRNAYFSIQDAETRKKLIKILRRIEKIHSLSFEDDIAEARKAVNVAKAQAAKQPWLKAAFFSGGIVAMGYSFFNMQGAIGGAIVGFFVGQGIIGEAKSAAYTQSENAAMALKDAKQSLNEHNLWPECFNLNEELTGERDKELDRQSAWGNILQAQSKTEN